MGAGSLEEAEEHLRRACQLFPEYGYNQLSLAKVLIDRKKTSEARVALKKVIASAPPVDETKDHEGWVAEARALLIDLDKPS